MADYIDRAEAIKALREFGETCKDSAEAATAVSVAISVLSRVPSPWVSTTEKLPFRGSGVITCVRHGAYLIPRYSWLDGVYDWVGVIDGEHVTHWMPLPDLPDAPEVAT